MSTAATAPEQNRDYPGRGAIAALTAAYVLSQFFRSYVAVVAPEMTRDLSLTPAQFGAFSSAFFFAFAVAQIPLGVVFDRIGAIRPMAGFLMLGAASASGIASARSYHWALVAQIGLGLSFAPVFMGLIHYVYERSDHSRAVRVTALASAVGALGSLVAATPLGWLSQQIGWRGALAAFAAVAVLVAVAVLLFAGGPGGKRRYAAPLPARCALAPLIHNRRMWTLIPACLVMSTGGTFRNAWAGPFLADLHHLDVIQRGHAMAVASITGAGTAFIIARMALRWSPKAVGIGGLTLGLVCGIALAVAPAMNTVAAVAMMSIWFGVGGIHPLIMAQGRQVIPAQAGGLGLGILNSCVFLGIALASSGFGAIAETLSVTGVTQEALYGQLFLAAAFPLAIALVPYVFSPGEQNATGAEEASETLASNKEASLKR